MEKSSLMARIRSDVRAMKPYVSARSLAPLSASDVLLDANEMPYTPLLGKIGYNQYADQQPAELLSCVAAFLEVDPKRLLVSRGADEAIDILVRLFCQPGQESILITPPAFPMYPRAAQLNGNRIISVPLDRDFQLDLPAIYNSLSDDTKLVFICTPNNPVGQSVREEDIVDLCKNLKGTAAVVVDEAYIEFSDKPSTTRLIDLYDNLIVLRTLSKAMGLAGVRCGGMIAREDIIQEALKVLAVYPVPVPVLETVLDVMSLPNRKRMEEKRKEIIETKKWFMKKIEKMKTVDKVFSSDANFVLVRFKDSQAMNKMARDNGFVLRDQSNIPHLENCIRISVGTRDQMETLSQLIETGKLEKGQTDRTGLCARKTKETAIQIHVNLDSVAPVDIHTGIGFFDHMLDQIATHAGLSLTIEVQGDTHVDAHHTVEDTAIALGQALRQALGDNPDIERYGFTLPMDDALAQIALDLGGRGLLVFKGAFADQQIGDMPSSLIEHFFRSLAENMQATLHLSVDGKDGHHQCESCFKVFGRALRQAICLNSKETLGSSKGVL